MVEHTCNPSKWTGGVVQECWPSNCKALRSIPSTSKKKSFLRKVSEREDPRWWLEGGSRKHASYSEILERHWRHTLQAKPLRRGKTLTPPHIQPVQRIYTSRQTEKPGGPPGCQSPMPRWVRKMQTSLLSISTPTLPVYTFETFLFDSLFCFFLLVYLFIPFSLPSCIPSPLTLPF
jgi:hypothetical protein